LRASETLKKVRTHNDDQKTGVEIVRKALSWPARQISFSAAQWRRGKPLLDALTQESG
jgi:chaperonin GroEL